MLESTVGSAHKHAQESYFLLFAHKSRSRWHWEAPKSFFVSLSSLSSNNFLVTSSKAEKLIIFIFYIAWDIFPLQLVEKVEYNFVSWGFFEQRREGEENKLWVKSIFVEVFFFCVWYKSWAKTSQWEFQASFDLKRKGLN